MMEAPAQRNARPVEALMPLVYEELRALARAYFRKQPPSFTLRPTDVVHEACLHLLRHGRQEWESPEHFRAIATRKMWQVIVDHLKRRHARKRGGPARPAAREAQPVAKAPVAQQELHPPTASAQPELRPARRQRVPLDTVAIEWCDQTVDLLDLADALDALEGESHRLRDVVMLHWFGGLKHAEVARVLGLSPATVEKDFRYALAWLNRRLTGGTDGD